MPTRIAAALVLLVHVGVALAQAGQTSDITGDWQGTEKYSGLEFRDLLHVWKLSNGNLMATLTYVDTGGKVQPVTTISTNGSTVVFQIQTKAGSSSFEGSLSQDNSSITGLWTPTSPEATNVGEEFRRVTLQERAPKAVPSDIDGYWVGRLGSSDPRPGSMSDSDSDFSECLASMRSKTPYVFHITNTADGLKATWNSPNQDLYGWPATSINRDGASLDIELKQFAARFRGTINGKKTVIGGTWTDIRQGRDYLLLLTRTKDMPKPEKLQGPVPLCEMN